MTLPDPIETFRQKLENDSDKDIYQEYILPHFQIMFNSAWRLSGNREDAEDLVQETFFYAIKNFSQLRDRNKCKYWLFAILKNLFLKEIEKGKKRLEMEFDLFSNHLHDINNIENELIKDETKKNIRALIDKMDDRLKRPILMFYYERLSYKEVAESLNIPIGTVMSRIARGKVFLKKELIRSREFQIEVEKLMKKL